MPPLVEVKEGVVQNFGEIRVWGNCNSVFWHKAEQIAENLNLTELDFLRLLSSTLLHEVEELRSRLTKVIQETVWQPHA